MTEALECQLLVIGGGSTGAGVAWDAALRGFQVILADRGDLATGTTGRFHGLLHSGGRYAVRDPGGARECARENVILRRVATAAIEDTGGLFVTTPLDDLDYADRFLAACPDAEVIVEEISVSEALRREPRLNPKIRRAFAVADGSIDSWKLVWGCAHGAEQHGAKILPYHPVTALVREGDRVVGARLHDLRGEQEVEVRAECVINAAGAWSGQIARLAGCEVGVRPGKGVMVAVNHRLADSVVNRCHLTGDGDIVVPSHSVSVIGTTDTPVEDPDDIEATPAEVAAMLEAADALLPGFSRSRALRVWTGARPLLPKTAAAAGAEDDRAVSRSHTVLRHRERDGVAGFVSIAGGKLTTFRLMAKDTVDAVCAELGVERPCKTAETPLPGSTGANYYRLPDHQREFEQGRADNPMICECELVSEADLLEAAERNPHVQIDDLRRVLRVGMGPCQGGFCAFRTAAILHGHGEYERAEANAALRAFVQERWKGQRPVLWGQQLRQARLDAWIFQGVLDLEHVPS
jgi:glycerol-3-phosphate dehydrogenase